MTFLPRLRLWFNIYVVCLLSNKRDLLWLFKRFIAVNPGLIHYYLHNKMHVPGQEYDSCCPFVWCVWAFDFAILWGAFRFEFPLEFSIFVITLSCLYRAWIYILLYNVSRYCEHPIFMYYFFMFLLRFRLNTSNVLCRIVCCPNNRKIASVPCHFIFPKMTVIRSVNLHWFLACLYVL